MDQALAATVVCFADNPEEQNVLKSSLLFCGQYKNDALFHVHSAHHGDSQTEPFCKGPPDTSPSLPFLLNFKRKMADSYSATIR